MSVPIFSDLELSARMMEMSYQISSPPRGKIEVPSQPSCLWGLTIMSYAQFGYADKPFSTFYGCICSHFPFLVLWGSEKGSDLPVGGPDVHQVRQTPLGLLTSLCFFMTDPNHLHSRKPHGHLQRKWAHNIQQLGSERHFKLIVFNDLFF